jgi:hypothetical protein
VAAGLSRTVQFRGMTCQTFLLLLGSLILVGAGATGLEQSSAASVRSLSGPLHHVQGIDIEGDSLWVSSVDRGSSTGLLSRVDLKTGRIEKQVQVQEGQRFHPGGICLDADFLWVPVAEYRRAGSSVVQKRDKRTMALVSSFAVDDHIGCVAVGPDRVAGGNWDSAELYFWTRDGGLLRKEKNRHGNRYQDLKWAGRELVGSGILASGAGPGGAVDWLDSRSLELVRRVPAGRTDRGIVLTNEGMTLKAGRLFLLPEDDPSRLFVFDLK